jgi:hypothetical protein
LRRAVLLGLAAAWIATGGTAGGAPEPHPGLTVPVVLVPGVTGTALRERDGGAVLWGRGKNLVLPRDGGYRLALPLGTSPGAPTTLEPAFVLEKIRLGPLVKPIYGPLLRLLEARGLPRGDLAAPHPGELLFAFAYDWRRSNVESAGRLAEQLAGLRRVRGEERLRVRLLCQSGGAHICRWLAKYGAATLEQAEGGAGPLPWLEIETLVLAGSANGGALRILRELDRGRSYLPPGLGRRLTPEVLFTFPSLFQDLVGYREDLFLDEDGRPLAIDLFDPASWERHGWSVFAPRTREHLERRNRPDVFGDEEDRRAYLARQLADARRFRRLLEQDPPGFVAPRLVLVANAYKPTAERAVVAPAGGRRRLSFTGDRLIRRGGPLWPRATAPGDGHATVASQRALSPAELAALEGEPLYVPGDHFTLLHHPAARRRFVEVLTGL